MPTAFMDPVAVEQQRLGLFDVSARLINGAHVWDELKKLLEPRQHDITAAIAYIGAAAADWLPVASGSSLITNASLEAVRAGTTDPNVLLKWTHAGVRVYSLDSLHAKLIIAAGIVPFVIVGSANASASSAEVLQEATLIADVDEVVDDANVAMIDWKQQATHLTAAAITSLIPEFRAQPRRRRRKTPKDLGPGPADAPWPKPTEVYIIRAMGDPDSSDDAKATLQLLRKANSIPNGDSAELSEFDLDMFYRVNAPGTELIAHWKLQEGAHVVIVSADRAGGVRKTSALAEPGKLIHTYVDSGASPPRTYYYVLSKASLEDHNYGELKQALAAIGEELEEDRHYLRSTVVDAIIGVWTDIKYTK